MSSERSKSERIEREEARKYGVVSRFTPRQGLLAVLAVLALWFVFSNGQSVQVHYFVGTSNMPLWIVIVISIALGMLIDRLLVFRGRRKKRD